MNLTELSDIAQVVGAVTVVAGTLFALKQLSEMRQQRADVVACELMRSFLDAEMTRAIRLIRTLPDGVSAEELRLAGPEAELAALRIGITFETMGLLVYRRIAPLDLVVELAGGMVVAMWRKIGPLEERIRIEQAQPSSAEWFQWLAEQCAASKDERMPAHIAHQGWKP
jgi:hypothetical protein